MNKNLSAVHLYSLEATGEPQIFPLDRQEALGLKKTWKAQGISVFCSTAAGGCGGELVPAVAEWVPGVRQMIPHLRHKVKTERVRECLSNVERQQTAQHWLMQLAFAGHFRRAGFQVTVEATHSNLRRSDLLITGGVLGERAVALEIQLTEQHDADDAYRTSRHYLGTNRRVEAVQWVRGWESAGYLHAVLSNAGELVLRNGPLPAEGRLSDAEEEQLAEQTHPIDSKQDWASAPLETIRINPDFTVDEYGITRNLLVSEHLWDQNLYYERSRKLAAVKKIAKAHEKYMQKVTEIREAAREREAQRKAEQKTWIGWTEQQEARFLEEQEYFQRHKRPWGVSEGRFRRDRAQARIRSEGALLDQLADEGLSLPRLLCTTSVNQGQWLSTLLAQEYAGMSKQAQRLGLVLSDQELEHGHLFSLRSGEKVVNSFLAHTKELPAKIVMEQEIVQALCHLIYAPATISLQKEATNLQKPRFVQAFEVLGQNVFTGIPCWATDPSLTPAQQFVSALAAQGCPDNKGVPASFCIEWLRGPLLATLLAYEHARYSAFTLESFTREYAGWTAGVTYYGEEWALHFTYQQQDNDYYYQVDNKYYGLTQFWAWDNPQNDSLDGLVYNMAVRPDAPGFLALAGWPD